MTRDVHDALASQFDEYRVRDRLHDVPPHAVYEVTVDGRRAACKVARGPAAPIDREGAVLRYLDAATTLPVPAVLATGSDYFVAEWLDALPAPEAGRDPAAITEGYARALGRGMARLHEATAGEFDRYGFPEGRDDDAAGAIDGGEDDPEAVDGGDPVLAVDGSDAWPGAVCTFLERRLSYLERTDWAEPCREALEFVRSHPSVFDGAGDPVLCHGNLLPDHVAVEGDEVTATIDVEHALVAPGEYDVWRTALPLFVSPGSGAPDGAFGAFREGYESVRALPAGFDRCRDAYLLVNTASYLRALHLQNDGIGPDERPRAEGMAAWIAEKTTELRATLD